MSIKKCCENCIYQIDEKDNCFNCSEYFCSYCGVSHMFTPKEELIRADEREKVIEIMKMHLEDYQNAKGYFKQVLDDLKEE